MIEYRQVANNIAAMHHYLMEASRISSQQRPCSFSTELYQNHPNRIFTAFCLVTTITSVTKTMLFPRCMPLVQFSWGGLDSFPVPT